MSGTFIFKPLQAHLTHNRSHIGKMSPYCEVVLGKEKVKGQVAKSGGQNPQWIDVIIMRGDKKSECTIIVKSVSTFSPDRRLGECKLDLEKMLTERKSTRWVDLYYKGKKEGELLIEVGYTGEDEKIKPVRRREMYVLKERNRNEPEEYDQLIK